MHVTIPFKKTKQTSGIRNILLLLVSLAAVQSFTHAQFDPPQPTFYNYSINEGLPSSETYFVHQDKKGYIWICTDRGVARYNGYKMQVFTEKDGLPDNVVFKIYEDYKGRLWFLTYNGLLSYWDGSRIVPYKYNYVVKKYLGGDITTYKSLSVDRNGTIWYSAQYKGLVSISANGTMKRIKHRPVSNLFLYRTEDNWLMCGLPVTDVNLPMGCSFIENGIQKQIGHIERSPRLSVTDNDYFVQVGDQVIYMKNPAKRRSVSNLIAVIGLNEYLWYCTGDGIYREAVYRFGKDNLKISAFLKGYTVTSVCRDFEGGYWFSTLEKGIFYTPAIDLAVYQKKSDDNYNVITGVTKLSNELFYANKYGVHLLSYSIRKGPFSLSTSTARVDAKYNRLFNSVDQTLPRSAKLTDKHGNGKSGYFDVFFDKNNTFFSHCDVIKLRNDNTSEVLYWYLEDRGDFPQHYFHAIMEDEKGRVFTGNNNGLFEVRKQRLFTHQFKDPRFKKRVADLDFHPDWKGIAATRGIGIYFFDAYKITRHITTKEGLLDDQINSIFVDDADVIWVCSNKGLNRISKDPNGKIVVRSLTTQNGLPSNEVNRVFAKNGEVWIATKNGLVHIPITYDWSTKRLKNQLSIDYLETKGQFFRNFKKSISFPSTTDYLKIVLASSNFRTGKNKKIRYRYAHTDDWLLTTDGELLLTKPASGDYALEISYLNEYGLWSKPTVMCRFSIDSPYYFKWYAVLLYIVLTALIVMFFFKRRIKQIQRKNQQQKNMQQLERKALQAQMNPHFIFNSLNSIQSFLLYEENEKAERFLLKFAQLIRQTLNNSRVSYITIESEIDTLRKYLELEQMRFKEKFSFTISVQLQPDQMLLGIPPMLIQPFVENAVLHGFKSMQSGGEITISFASLSSNRLMCVIQDNGIGRNEAGKQQKESQHLSFGTKITAERLFAYQQKNSDEFKIEIIDLTENGQASGTKVIMWIPVVPAEEFDSEDI